MSPAFSDPPTAAGPSRTDYAQRIALDIRSEAECWTAVRSSTCTATSKEQSGPVPSLELAHREHHPLASGRDPREALVADGKLTDLLAYLERVDAAAAVFTREADWTRAAREVVLDAYDEGLDALELRFSPWFIHSRTGLRPEAVIDAVAAGVAEARALVDLPVGLIGILLRDLGPDSALPQLDSILQRSEHFCAIDIAGNEACDAARLFAPAYDRAPRPACA